MLDRKIYVYLLANGYTAALHIVAWQHKNPSIMEENRKERNFEYLKIPATALVTLQNVCTWTD